MRIEPKLRTSIIEGISVFLALFDANPRVKYTFCPPKETYDPAQNPQGIHGTPLPPLAELIEQGKIVALNFPIAMNPGLARVGHDAEAGLPARGPRARPPDGSGRGAQPAPRAVPVR
jgi:hypothetical protein